MSYQMGLQCGCSVDSAEPVTDWLRFPDTHVLDPSDCTAGHGLRPLDVDAVAAVLHGHMVMPQLIKRAAEDIVIAFGAPPAGVPANTALLREALTEIRDNQGWVCAAFDLCSESECVAPACQPWRPNSASYAAWHIADEALGGTRDSANVTEDA